MSTRHIDLTNNKAVIEALQRDSSAEEAFAEVYTHYYAALCGYAARIVPIAVAEEICQNTMVWLWENREALRSELSLKSLLFTIVRNKSLDNAAHLKLRARIHQSILSKNENKFNDPDDYLSNELYKLFSDALQNLPERYRISFEMSRIEGKTHQQIAEELGVAPQTVNYHISEAMKRLKKDLKDYLPLFLLYISQK